MAKVLVVGGGAAGMMAAVSAAEKGNEVILAEKNEKLGKKLFITGKGRCNLTNSCDPQEIFQQIVSNPKFLYSAIYGFDNKETMDFFQSEKLRIKVERGNRVFPESDKSSDVIRVFEKKLISLGVKVMLCHKAVSLLTEDESVVGAVLEDKNGRKKNLYTNSVILATGGLSYASTGSTGDGIGFAKDLGHRLVPCIPSLVPMEIRENYAVRMQGLSLKNVDFSLFYKKKKIFHERGEMLFTHFGISGPLVLSASTRLPSLLRKDERAFDDIRGEIDWKPALSEKQLNDRLLGDLEEGKRKDVKNVFDRLLPQKALPVIMDAAGISPDRKGNTITKEDRNMLVNTLKHFSFDITGIRDFNEAIITSGGVNVRDVNPSTMESKLIRNLYFAGEMLDVDAVTGGYNLQIAWSTGRLAGISQ